MPLKWRAVLHMFTDCYFSFKQDLQKSASNSSRAAKSVADIEEHAEVRTSGVVCYMGHNCTVCDLSTTSVLPQADQVPQLLHLRSDENTSEKD